jgi:MYXO-CTERM domain-containing protein
VSESPKPSPTSSHLPPLSLWLALQLLALLLPTLHISLSDDFPRPIERLAMHEMLVVQITAAAMLFPMLFKTIPTTIALIATTWPFLQLAAMLSATPALRLLLVALYLTLWMIALALINSTLRTDRARLRAAALATSFTLAGPLLWYLHHEFNPNPDARLSMLAFNPLLSALEILNSADRSAGAWSFIGLLLALSLAAALLLRRRAKRDNLSTPHPQTLSTAPETPPLF